MAVFWFLTGAAACGSLLWLVLKGPARSWWQWALIFLLEAWFFASLALSLYTFAEGNTRGGGLLLAVALFSSLAFLAVLRALLRLGGGKGKR